MQRIENRRIVSRECIIEKGVASYKAVTLNASETGLCVISTLPSMFAKDDHLHIIVEELGIDSEADVVWERISGRHTFKAGLKYC